MNKFVREMAGSKTAGANVMLLNPAGEITRLTDVVAAVS